MHQAPTVPKYPGSPGGPCAAADLLGSQPLPGMVAAHRLPSWVTECQLEAGQKPSGVWRATSRSTLDPLLELRVGVGPKLCKTLCTHRIHWHNWHLQTQVSMSTTYTRTFLTHTHTCSHGSTTCRALVPVRAPRLPRLSLRHPDGGLAQGPSSTKALAVPERISARF